MWWLGSRPGAVMGLLQSLYKVNCGASCCFSPKFWSFVFYIATATLLLICIILLLHEPVGLLEGIVMEYSGLVTEC